MTTGTTAAPAPTDDKARKKAEKAARKLEKEARRADKAAKKAAKASKRAEAVEKERSPSPEFKVHSAKHDPFKVSSEIPTAASTQPTGLASVFGSMFARSTTGGMGATFVPPTSSSSVLPSTIEVAETVAVVEPAPQGSKDKKDGKKKRKSSSEDKGTESKAERRARKEAKRAKKAEK